MQLTRAADYAVRVMVALEQGGSTARVSLAELAGSTEAPESFLSKVLQALARAGLIESQRGHGGGFGISPAGRLANMRQVVEAIDGPIALNACVSEDRDCARAVRCPAHPVWARAQRAMLRILEEATIADMAQCRRGLRPYRESALVESICSCNAAGHGH